MGMPLVLESLYRVGSRARDGGDEPIRWAHQGFDDVPALLVHDGWSDLVPVLLIHEKLHQRPARCLGTAT